MATVDMRPATGAKHPSKGWATAKKTVYQYDFSATNIPSGDTINLMYLEAMHWHKFIVTVDTAETGDIDLVTTETIPQQIMASGVISSTGTLYGDGDDADSLPLWFWTPAACGLNAVANAAFDSGKITVRVLSFDMAAFAV